MSKKIIYGILILTIIVGATLIATIGLNLSIEYNENTKIYVYIGKKFENKEIKQIVSEVFKTNKVTVRKVEVYEDMACITTEKQNSENLNERIEELNAKINEKYELENKTEDIVTKNEPKIKVYTIVKPYIWPVIISSVIIIICSAIIFRKIGIIKTIITYILSILGSQALYMSIIAIARIPVDKYTMPIALIVYMIAITATTIIKQKQLENYKLNEK